MRERVHATRDGGDPTRDAARSRHPRLTTRRSARAEQDHGAVLDMRFGPPAGLALGTDLDASRIRRSEVAPGADHRSAPGRIRASTIDIHRSPLVIQRAGDHFLKYLRSAGQLNPAANAGDRTDVLEAWLLDQNIFTLEMLLSEAVAVSDDPMDSVTVNDDDLSPYGLTPADAVNHLRGLGAPRASAGTEERMTFLSGFVTAKSTRVTNAVSNRHALQGGGAMSTIDWHGLTSWGAGTGVTLTMRPGGIPQGSTPKSDPAWIKTIDMHIPPKGKQSSIYVRGHLLNHNIGGPGLDYNMVPLTGPQALAAGGNNANKVHEKGIEDEVKKTWPLVKSGQLSQAQYIVQAVHNRTRRQGTDRVVAQARLMRDFLRHVAATFQASLKQVSDAALGHSLQQKGIDVTKIDRGQAELLATSGFTNEIGQMTLPQLAGVNPQAAQALSAVLDVDIATASLQGRDPTTVSLLELQECLAGNAMVWEWEDVFVPTKLNTSLQTWAPDGTSAGPKAFPVDVILPSNPAEVRFRPMTQTELKLMG